MRTDNTLRSDFGKGHDWQTKELIPIEITTVITLLLTEKFVVEIDGHKYDLSFGYNKKAKEIGWGWSASPSPHLMSYEIIEKAFSKGKWFLVKEK